MRYELDKPEVFIPGVYLKKCEPDDHTWNVFDEIAIYMAYEEVVYDTRFDGNNYRTCALISPTQHPYVNEVPGDENRELMNKFEKENCQYQMHRFRLLHTYGGEEVYFIKDILPGEAFYIAYSYNQYSFIFKDKDGCREICAIPFKNKHGYMYRNGEVVKNYDQYAYGAYSTRDFANMLLRKTKTVEIDGIEQGNYYEPKTWFDLYYISEAHPEYKPPAPSRRMIRLMQLIESKYEE